MADPTAGPTADPTLASYGYAENKGALLNRLNRAEGQVRGVARMVDTDEYCVDILTQISAARAALDRVALELVRTHAKHCLTSGETKNGSTDDKADELVTALGRLIGR